MLRLVLFAPAAFVCTLVTPISAVRAAGPHITGISVQGVQDVLGPTGHASINKYGGGVLGVLPDKSQTIFPPGTFSSLSHPNETLFFVPTGGLVVLTDGGNGPDSNGVWRLGFTQDYPHGPVFLAPYDHGSCPCDENGAPLPDATFDLNYGMPGTVLQDPVNPGSLFMIYGATNNCIGSNNCKMDLSSNFYATIGVATAGDPAGKTWPMYNTPNTVPLPGRISSGAGPNSPEGAIGPNACLGPDCTLPVPSASFGRYPVSSVPFTLEAATAGPTPSPLPVEVIGNNQPPSPGQNSDRSQCIVGS